jgi:hypothetical protein
LLVNGYEKGNPGEDYTVPAAGMVFENRSVASSPGFPET